MEDILSCSICLGRYAQPKMLPCQHSFCLSCLKSMNYHLKISCPYCRQESALPYNGVDGLPNNLTLISFLDASTLQQAPTKAHCQDCRKNNIEAECGHCDKILCSDCLVSHSNKGITQLQQIIEKVENTLQNECKQLMQWNQEISQGYGACTQVSDHTKQQTEIYVEFETKYQKKLSYCTHARAKIEKFKTTQRPAYWEILQLILTGKEYESEVLDIPSFQESKPKRLAENLGGSYAEEHIGAGGVTHTPELATYISEATHEDNTVPDQIDNFSGTAGLDGGNAHIHRLATDNEDRNNQWDLIQRGWGAIHSGTSSGARALAGSNQELFQAHDAARTSAIKGLSISEQTIRERRQTLRNYKRPECGLANQREQENQQQQGTVENFSVASRRLRSTVSEMPKLQAITTEDIPASIPTPTPKPRLRRKINKQVSPSTVTQTTTKTRWHRPAGTACWTKLENIRPTGTANSTGSSFRRSGIQVMNWCGATASPTPPDYTKQGKVGWCYDAADCGGFSQPCGMATRNNGDIIVADAGNKRCLVVKPFKGIQTTGGWHVGEGRLGCPISVAVAPSGEIIVADLEEHKIKIFDRNGNKMTSIDTFALSVASSNDGFIFTAYESNTIRKRALHGNFIQSFGEDWLDSLNEPKCLTSTQDNKVIVFESSKQRLLAFGCSGGLSWKIKTGSELREPCCKPSGITCDRHGNIIVADAENHKIMIYDKYGAPLSEFGEKGSEVGQLMHPAGVAVLGNGNIAVSDTGNNRIQIFEF